VNEVTRGATLFDKLERGLGYTFDPSNKSYPYSSIDKLNLIFFIIKESFLNLNNTMLVRNKE